jgi:RNA polymerase sigma-70 factor (ECF subfamily)
MDQRLFLKHFLQEELLLRSYLLASTGDAHAAEDLLQEVAGVLWEKFRQYDPSRPFRPWALGVARLEVLKWRQRLARRREVLSEQALEFLSDAAADLGPELDRREAFLRDCLRALKQRAQQVLEMRYGQGLSVREMAARLQRSVEAVEMMLVRIRRALRDCIERKLAQAARGTP